MLYPLKSYHSFTVLYSWILCPLCLFKHYQTVISNYCASTLCNWRVRMLLWIWIIYLIPCLIFLCKAFIHSYILVIQYLIIISFSVLIPLLCTPSPEAANNALHCWLRRRWLSEIPEPITKGHWGEGQWVHWSAGLAHSHRQEPYTCHPSAPGQAHSRQHPRSGWKHEAPRDDQVAQGQKNEWGGGGCRVETQGKKASTVVHSWGTLCLHTEGHSGSSLRQKLSL